jgi:hypothetical protein
MYGHRPNEESLEEVLARAKGAIERTQSAIARSHALLQRSRRIMDARQDEGRAKE